MTRVLLLEAAGPESEALVATAVAAGIEVYVATHQDIHDSYDETLRASLTGSLITDFTNPGTAVRDIVAFAVRKRVDGILTLHEFLTPIVTLACATLGLPGNSAETASAARNKIDMGEQFVAHGVTAPTSRVVTCAEDLRVLLDNGEIDFPCVVKPAENAGSTGVTIAQDATEARAAYRRTLRHDRQASYGIPLDRRVVVQDYLHGTEYSVESVTQDGKTTHLCITRKLTTANAYRIELGHGLPALIPPGAAGRILAESTRAVAATGIRNAASHTEVKLDASGRCAVIEIAARPGAGQIGFLINLALGVDLWQACLDIALGRPVQISRTRNRYATVRFLTSPRPGRLTAIKNLPEISPRVPLVRMRKNIGDIVDGLDSNSARLGYVLVTGPDARSIDRHAERLLARVQIEVTPIGEVGAGSMAG